LDSSYSCGRRHNPKLKAVEISEDTKAVKNCLAITTFFLLCATACSAVVTAVGDETQKSDVQEVVRQAVINFNTREALPQNYTYVEKLTDSDPQLKDGHGTDTYEVMEIRGHAFRKHVAHNDKGIAVREDSELEEANRAKWAEVDRKILEEQIKPGHTKETLAAAVQKIMEESGLKDWKPRTLSLSANESMGVVSFPQTLHQFKLPIGDLAQKFRLNAKGEVLRDGRKTYVVQADPLHAKDEDDPAANFKIKIWIDEKELQIVRVEGRAVRAGPISRADYAAFSSKTLSAKEVEDRKKKLSETRLFYGDDTVIIQEWAKVNDEAWLQRRRHVKGSHEVVIDQSAEGFKPYFARSSSSASVEYDTLDTNYKKFRVEHRILPVGTTK
jgi:hypothetical protein